MSVKADVPLTYKFSILSNEKKVQQKFTVGGEEIKVSPFKFIK